jgi:hypothetical protein
VTLATTPTYEANLKALSIAQPLVAERLASTPIPSGVQPTVGRDGTNTLLIPGQCGDSVWFGRSSMPSVSATETSASLASDGQNALLPGVQSGFEPIVIAGKMPPHTALFVVEESPLHLKLALHLYDYAGLITNGRIVFLLADDIAGQMCAVLQKHPGYEVPTQLLQPPQYLPAQIVELQRKMESAGPALSGVYNGVLKTCTDRLRSRTFGALPEPPRVAVVSVDVRPASHEQACRVGRALTQLGWPHEICVPDNPRNCHIAARLQAVDRVSADVVLLINTSPGAMHSVLPAELPTISWYLPGSGVASTAGVVVTESQPVFVASKRTGEELRRTGVPADVIKRCEPSADDTTFHPTERSAEDQPLVQTDVALLADLPDDRPEACGITLASHRQLWQAIQETVSKNVSRYRDSLAPELVDNAQAACGVRLQDATLRDQLVSLVRGRVAPACIARATAETLAGSVKTLAIWGRNWSLDSRFRPVHRGPIPVGKALNDVFHLARQVVFTDSSEMAIQTALDALAAGVRVVCRAADDSFDRVHPGLAKLAPHFHFCRTQRELSNNVRRITTLDANSVREEAETARALVLAEHTVSQRVLAIIDHIRAR